MWGPITWLSHALDCQLYGLQPWGHHLTNLLLHAATTASCSWFCGRRPAIFGPALVAAVFAVHPLRVEPVAWIAERKGLLAGLFWMLTLAVYVRYARRPFSLAAYMSMTALFALGLMSKPVLVTLPFVMLLLDYWPLGRMNATKPRSSIAPSPARSSIAHLSSAPSSAATEARSPIAALWRLIAEKLPLLAMSAAVCLAWPLPKARPSPRSTCCPCPRASPTPWFPTWFTRRSCFGPPTWPCCILMRAMARGRRPSSLPAWSWGPFRWRRSSIGENSPICLSAGSGTWERSCR